MRAIAAVVTDLDGTAVRRDGTVSAATLRAADALRARGVPLIAATARTPFGLRALPALARRLSFAVCCSGAVGLDPGGVAPAWIDPLPRDTVTALLAYLARDLPEAGVAAFDGAGWRVTRRYRDLRPTGHRGPVAVVGEAAVAPGGACAMVVCHPGRTAPELIATLTAAGFDAGRVTLGHAGPRFVEVIAPAAGKARGVLRALRLAGVPPDRAVTFGDMPIDVPMFAVTGHSVAMGDAPPEVLAAATARTGSAEDDGFARMLARLGLTPDAVAPEPAHGESAPPRAGA